MVSGTYCVAFELTNTFLSVLIKKEDQKEFCLHETQLLLYGLPEKQHHFIYFVFVYLLKKQDWTSLVVQWLRIHLLMQGAWVQYLVQEDPTCGVTKPLCHN